MESPSIAPETPTAIADADDIPYPCKGCGEVREILGRVLDLMLTNNPQILEEGKAFELGKARRV